MDLQEAFDAGFEAVKAFVDASFADIEKRLVAIEKREPPRGEKGEPGPDGKSVSLDDLAPIIAGEVAKAVALIPVPKDGRDGIDGNHGKDGASVSVDDLAPAIGDAVAKAVALIPVPKDGRDGIDGKDGIDGVHGKDGAPGERGAIGEPGRDGRDGLPGVQGPKGLDGVRGKDGRDGVDGLSMENLAVRLLDDGQTAVLSFQCTGGVPVERELRFPVLIDQGVWREGAYRRGQGVTFGGSFWIAQKDTETKPDTPDSDWRLAVKRGRDGKDGVMKAAAPTAKIALR